MLCWCVIICIIVEIKQAFVAQLVRASGLINPRSRGRSLPMVYVLAHASVKNPLHYVTRTNTYEFWTTYNNKLQLMVENSIKWLILCYLCSIAEHNIVVFA